MKIVDLSIRRPIATLMITLMVVSIGIFSYNDLSLDLMPDITFPIISIQTDYEGVSSQEIETLITRPIEEVASTIESADKVTSQSLEGRSIVRLSFKWGVDLDELTNDLRAKIDRIRERLPEDANTPIVFKFDLRDIPIIFLGISGNMSWVKLREYADKELKHRFERLSGVAQVVVRGGLEREIVVELRYNDIQAKNLSINEVVSAIRSENIDIAAGNFSVGRTKYVVKTKGKFKNIDEISDVVIKTIDGIPIKVRDVAYVKDKYKDISSFVRVNAKNALLLMIVKQPDGNTIDVANRIRQEVNEISSDPNRNIDIAITRDTSKFIKRSISNVQQAALFGGLIAILVLLFFLRSVRSTFIIACSMFISIIATFIFMKGVNFTLNMMSFGGLALGIGMLVDNSIVVIENIFRHKDEAKNSMTASSIGTSEVSMPITVSTITSLVVFLPLFFLEGAVGVMFGQLAYMISFALIASLLVAITIIPSFSAKFLSFNNKANHRVFIFISNGISLFLDKIASIYNELINKALSRSKLTVSLFAIVFLFSLLLLGFMGFDFMPLSDEGEIRITAELPVGTNLKTTDLKFREIESILLKDYNNVIESIYARIGQSGYRRLQENAGRMILILKALSIRGDSSDRIASRIRKSLSKVSNVKLRVYPSSFFIFRFLRGGDERISLEILGHNLKAGDKLAKRIMGLIKGIEGIHGLRQSREYGSPEYAVYVDRQKAKEAGLSVRLLGDYLQTALLGKVSTRYTDGEYEHDIRIRISEADINNIEAINNLSYPVAGGKKILLRSLINVKEEVGPIVIERLNQQRVIYIRGNIYNRDSQSVLTDIQDAINTIDLPSEFRINYGGIFEEQKTAYEGLYFIIVLAILLVYMVMAAQFESLKIPFIIMFTVPFSFSGVIMVFYLLDMSFDVQGFIGFIMLIGIVVNNSIVLVDFIERSRKTGISLKSAIIEASNRRLRPILMTSFTTTFALIPLAIGIGEGSELQVPMALSVIAGLSFSTFTSLLLIPCIYYLFFKRSY